MYTKKHFGLELKKLLEATDDPVEIGSWAFTAYWENVADMEDGVREIALTLNTMEDGPEFIRSHEELNQIADDLINGREIKM